MLSLEDVQRMTGIEALAVNSRGHIRFADGLTATVKRRYLKRTVAVYKKAEKEWRFLIGDMINDLFLPHGQKKAYCRNEFGEHQGITYYGYSLTAAHWNDYEREHEVYWSLFKESGPMPIQERLSIIQKVERRELKPDEALVECQEWKCLHNPTGSSGADIDLKTAQKPDSTGSTLTQYNTTILEPLAEILQASASQPPIVTVNALQQALDAIRDALCQEEETDRFAEE